ncbi:amino acid adenylation domain-containing protein [Streptomyces sp. NBC_01278]|uniref:non-ribosomal peptide synthetase n=1 Tax=unclassified Streptomyces TaxID=2593676 RepID=UPI002E1028A2|nr:MULTISPECIES: amino acid adenylation domain-containing protein [unclassified Streptomyces]WSR23786.1 amino acid adenylation domain-containing protein [Streptomyces sp. NBC_01205]
MLPLSSSQEIVWLHEQMQPGSRAYNFTASLDLWGTLDTDALRRGLAATLARHPGLRLELVASTGSVPAQRVAPQCAPRLHTVDLSTEEDPEAAFARLLRTEAESALDTFEAPLIRWTLVRLAERHHRLIHVEHHLIHDGHSFAILLDDVFRVYRAHVLGETLELPPAPSYADHVRAQARAEAAYAPESLDFWRAELRDQQHDLPLPGLARPGARRRHNGGQLRQTIGADLADRLRGHTRSRGLTPFATLLGLFAELLRRHSGRSRMVIGTAVGNRPRGYENAVGMFVNTIPLPLALDGAAPAQDTMDEVTDTLIRALPHQDVPVQELTRALGMHTSGADNPLFSVMFSAHDAPLPEIDIPGLDVTLFEGFNTGTTRFDLDVVLLPDDRRGVTPRHGAPGMTLVWDYDADLFGEDVARLLAGRFLDLLRAYLDNPEMPLADLEPTAVEPAAAPLPVPADRDPLDPVAAHHPSLPALQCGARHLTYGELDEQVGALVRRLRTAGVTPGRPVAAVLPRGADSVVALLACLRIGAVYCPLSPSDPPARLALLLERLSPALVLTGDGAPELPEALPTARIDAPVLPPAHGTAVLPGTAYVIHTSGSTGTPKSVAVGPAALVHHMTSAADRFGLTASDRVLMFAQPSFDVALEEVLPTLHAGACLVLPAYEVPTGAELAELLVSARVTVANLPTSYFLATREDLRPALRDGSWAPRLLVLGGERLPAHALRGVLADTDATVLNVYGVTEATISSTVHEVVRSALAESTEVPLGTEFPGERILVLDAHHRPLPAGAVGELAVAGPGLAEGYAGNADATAARFVTVDALDGQRVYLTGDLGYRGLDGLLYFLGRRDNQIKLRGHRIELEEIEAAASAVLGGRSCAVVLDREGPGGPRLVGFLEDGPGGAAFDEKALHAELGLRLPAPLVPARWARLDSMPTLAGGKPDRAALSERAAALDPDGTARPGTGTGTEPEYGTGSASGTGSEAGSAATPVSDDPMTALLTQGWRKVLGHSRFDAHSHFFHSGGHSLLAAELAAWLEPRLGTRPPLRVLFRNPVLADQAEALATTAASTSTSTES